MQLLNDFSERLSELMFEHELNTVKLALILNVSDVTIGRWKKGESSILLNNALHIADYFECSLQYLIGKTDKKLDFILHPHKPFYKRLRQIMAEHSITWYRIVKDGILSDNNISSWKNGTEPYLETVIDVANYFGLTIDQLVGREN